MVVPREAPERTCLERASVGKLETTEKMITTTTTTGGLTAGRRGGWMDALNHLFMESSFCCLSDALLYRVSDRLIDLKIIS